ncbi:alpha/beta hydrolase [Photobacterium japonica]|uniref:alpha/beta fold hydrolase n=1 Tax=Photobacterium japonica TaxID=2910235 RepID=UPI003D133A2F
MRSTVTMHHIEIPIAGSHLAGLCSFTPPDFSDHAVNRALPTDKPLLIMLHGWQDNAASFTPLFPALAAHFSVLAMDWPGHGLSPHRAVDNFSHFVDYVDDLAQVMAALTPPDGVLPPVILTGHSLGALVAVCYAAAFPEQVERLVLIEGLAPLSEPPTQAAERLRQGIMSRQRFRQRAQHRLSRSMATFEQALALRCHVNHLSAEQLRPIVTRGVYEAHGRWWWRHDPRLRCDSLYRMGSEHAQALASAVTAPILSIVGHHGYPHWKLSHAAQQTWSSLIQHEVTGGHHCHLESPHAVTEQILLFSSKIKKLIG